MGAHRERLYVGRWMPLRGIGAAAGALACQHGTVRAGTRAALNAQVFCRIRMPSIGPSMRGATTGTVGMTSTSTCSSTISIDRWTASRASRARASASAPIPGPENTPAKSFEKASGRAFQSAA
jgi:hypothetical protein